MNMHGTLVHQGLQAFAFGVQAATILPQGLLHKLIAGGAIIQLVILKSSKTL